MCIRDSSPLTCQVTVLDWCGPHHVTGLHGSLYWLHNANIHKREAKSPFEFLTCLAPDTQFLFVWGCLGVVHDHSGHPDKFKERGIPCIYVGTGYFDNVHGAKFLNPETGKILFSTNITMTEHFLPFKALDQNPGLVRDCFGMIGFRNTVSYTHLTLPTILRV